MTCRETQNDVETAVVMQLRDKAGACLRKCPVGIRHRGGVSADLGFGKERRNLCSDAKGEAQVGRTGESQSTDAGRRDGGARIGQKAL